MRPIVGQYGSRMNSRSLVLVLVVAVVNDTP